jgi:hypothetical protein
MQGGTSARIMVPLAIATVSGLYAFLRPLTPAVDRQEIITVAESDWT